MRSPRLPWLVTALGCLLVSVAGCSSGEDAPPGTVKACFYDLSGELKEGPGTGLELRGQLLMFERPGGGVATSFIPGGTADLLRVPATVDDGAVALEFLVPGGTVVGGAELGKSPADCTAPLKGTLAGPADDDAGSFTAVAICAGDARGCQDGVLVTGANEATCLSACTEAGHSEAACVDFCGTR